MLANRGSLWLPVLRRRRFLTALALIAAGRGARTHPDGVSRLVASALQMFADEVDRHLYARCRAAAPALAGLGSEVAQ